MPFIILKLALEAAKEALANGERDVEAIVDRLHGVRYMSTMVIEQLDPDFKTFFRIITPLDLKKAVVMLKPRTSTSKKGAAKAALMPIRRPKKHVVTCCSASTVTSIFIAKPHY